MSGSPSLLFFDRTCPLRYLPVRVGSAVEAWRSRNRARIRNESFAVKAGLTDASTVYYLQRRCRATACRVDAPRGTPVEPP